MRIVFLVGAVLAVAGCNDQPTPDPNDEIGRFQIVNDTKNDGVFWIDTRDGDVKQCMWNTEARAWQCYNVKNGILR